MDSPSLVERLRVALEKASALPWAYRPQEHDDWGVIRGREKTEWGSLPMVARGHYNEYTTDDDEHRRNKTDPFAPNSLLIVEVVNALPSLLARIEALEAALKPFAEQRTIDEIMTAKNEPPEWASATVERRIEMIGERKRQGTDNILRARTALNQENARG